MDIQHGPGHAEWTWTCTMDMNVHHGHRHLSWTWNAAWKWTSIRDMDIHQGHGHAPWVQICSMKYRKNYCPATSSVTVLYKWMNNIFRICCWHGHGNAAWTGSWTWPQKCSMYMDMQHGHRQAAGTYRMDEDMDLKHGPAHMANHQTIRQVIVIFSPITLEYEKDKRI